VPHWAELAKPGQTLALYMSVGSLESVARELTGNGLPAGTPAAIVENGTTGDQRVIHASIDAIAGKARAAGVSAPAMLFVGESVVRGKKLNWFGGDSLASRFLPQLRRSHAWPPARTRVVLPSK
jgi:uroporphyrin-III C-methyltransferase/precorrin-2 dehydrogenase/sirohydrochlorin ferrochelatase